MKSIEKKLVYEDSRYKIYSIMHPVDKGSIYQKEYEVEFTMGKHILKIRCREKESMERTVESLTVLARNADITGFSKEYIEY